MSDMYKGPCKATRELIEKIPKTDLHVHLDGSLRIQTLIDLSKAEKIELPSYTVEGLNEQVFKDSYANLDEYLTGFAYTGRVMQKPEYLEQVSYELALDNQLEGVRYIEVRFAPQLHVNKLMDMKEVFMSVNRGLKKAQDEFNNRAEVKNGSEPPFYYGIIACAMRNFGPWSEYYSQFINSLSYASPKEICRLGSIELARAAASIRDEEGIPIVGFDLAGAENGYPAGDHWQAFKTAHENFMHITVHAGEAYGAESIFQAITGLHAHRIGHGYFLFDPDKIQDPKIENREKYISQLIEHIADKRVTIEVCLTSNLQTNPEITSIEKHNFRKMLDNKLSTTICTDNRTVSKTTVTDELMLAIEGFEMTENQLKNSIVYGFKRCFFPQGYAKKREYVRQNINYYEKLIRDFQTSLL